MLCIKEAGSNAAAACCWKEKQFACALLYLLDHIHPYILLETDLNQWLCWWASGGRSKYRQRPLALLLAKAHRLFCVLAFLEMEHFHVAIIPWKLFALKMLTTLPDKGSDPIPATPYPHYPESAEHDRIECRWCLCKRV